jgi:hypothetical protein
VLVGAFASRFTRVGVIACSYALDPTC